MGTCSRPKRFSTSSTNYSQTLHRFVIDSNYWAFDIFFKVTLHQEFWFDRLLVRQTPGSILPEARGAASTHQASQRRRGPSFSFRKYFFKETNKVSGQSNRSTACISSALLAYYEALRSVLRVPLIAACTSPGDRPNRSRRSSRQPWKRGCRALNVSDRNSQERDE